MSPSTTTALINLPVGPNPGWELKNGDDEQLKPISESCVLLHALRQSRQRWLSSTFPRFSTRARGVKSIDQTPPPHTIQLRGKCDLEIGPHIFSDTLFYEVHYLPAQTHQPAPHSQQPPSSSWQVKLPYATSTQPAPSVSNGSQNISLQQPPTPLISSLNTVTTITPALINQVNTAAASNPTLANLLQLAAAGLATPEQLKTLGILIQSLATAETVHLISPSPAVQQPPAPATSTITTTPPPPIKEFDLVLEFRETPSERWVFPRGTVTCQRTTDASFSYTIINACLPFPKPSPLDNGVTDQPPHRPETEALQIVSFRLKNAPLAVWDTISRWAGDEKKMDQNKSKLEAIKPAEHVFLGYQLPQGPLLTQLQSATAPAYSMRSIKSHTTTARSRRRTTAKEKGDSSKPNGGQASLAKRSRVSRAERTSAPKIQCFSCKSQDVPLILGGRFCRPCVDAGRATMMAQPYSFTPYLLVPTLPPPKEAAQPTVTPPIDATQ